jgi:hypothetical protein
MLTLIARIFVNRLRAVWFLFAILRIDSYNGSLKWIRKLGPKTGIIKVQFVEKKSCPTKEDGLPPAKKLPSC